MSVTGEPTFVGGPPGSPVMRIRAGQPLRDEVESALGRVGPGQSVTGQRAIDQARIGSAQQLVAQAQPLHRADAKVFDDDIGPVDDAQQRGFGSGMLEIERNPALVAVHHHERARFAVDFGRREAPRVVAVGNRSTLITSAPMSASSMPAVGPDMMCAISMTLSPESGPMLGRLFAAEARSALGEERGEALAEIRRVEARVALGPIGVRQRVARGSGAG